jgi:hypothetical protein
VAETEEEPNRSKAGFEASETLSWLQGSGAEYEAEMIQEAHALH